MQPSAVSAVQMRSFSWNPFAAQPKNVANGMQQEVASLTRCWDPGPLARQGVETCLFARVVNVLGFGQ